MERERLKRKFWINLRSLVVVIFLFSLLPLFAKEEKTKLPIWVTRKGCIRAQGNLAPGYLFAQKQFAAYVNGDMDLFFDDRTAFTGSIWCSFLLQRETIGLKFNYAVFGGINYHFLKPSRWDPFVGLTPGLGVVRIGYESNSEIRQTPYTPIPLLSATLGCNYYVGWIFHFFVKVQGVTGQVFSKLPAPTRVDELKFMFGLGWNLRLWKPKKPDKWKERNKAGTDEKAF